MEGLAGGTRCAKALALADGVLRDEELEEVVRLPLRARFLGGDTDEETGCSKPSFFCNCGRLYEFGVVGEEESWVVGLVVCADVGNGMTLIS